MKIKMMEENVNRFKSIRNSIMEIHNIEDSQIAQYNKMVKMKFQLFAQIAVTRNNLILFGKIMLKKKKKFLELFVRYCQFLQYIMHIFITFE